MALFSSKLAALQQQMQGKSVTSLMQSISAGVDALVDEWNQHKLPLLEVRNIAEGGHRGPKWYGFGMLLGYGSPSS